MISHLVSSILNPAATAGAADKAASQQMEEDKNRQVPIASLSSKPLASRSDRVAINQSASGQRIDYFHTAKNMLRDALSDFSGGVRDSLADIGVEDGMATNVAQSVVKQTKEALLWGAGFSVKIMTATVSATSDVNADYGRPSFSIMAKSIEIKVNHSNGDIGVSSATVAIESQTVPGPGAQQPHLLDIKDNGGQPVTDLTSALQALHDPKTLLTNLDEDAGDDVMEKHDKIVPPERLDDLEKSLPQIDTPRVLSRADYRSRILLSEMSHSRNDHNELITHMRLDAIIPLTVEAVSATSFSSSVQRTSG